MRSDVFCLIVNQSPTLYFDCKGSCRIQSSNLWISICLSQPNYTSRLTWHQTSMWLYSDSNHWLFTSWHGFQLHTWTNRRPCTWKAIGEYCLFTSTLLFCYSHLCYYRWWLTPRALTPSHEQFFNVMISRLCISSAILSSVESFGIDKVYRLVQAIFNNHHSGNESV